MIDNKKVISQAWQLTRKHFWFFLIFLIFIAIVNTLISYFAQPAPIEGSSSASSLFFESPDTAYEPLTPLNIVFRIISYIVNILIAIATVTLGLDVINGQKPTFASITRNWGRFFTYLILSIVMGAIILAGLILLIIPGIIWALRYQFAPYLLLEKRLPIMDSINESARITKGKIGQLFIFALMLAGITILGLLALGIGLLWAFPTVIIANALMYRSLEQLSSNSAPSTGSPEEQSSSESASTATQATPTTTNTLNAPSAVTDPQTPTSQTSPQFPATPTAS